MTLTHLDAVGAHGPASSLVRDLGLEPGLDDGVAAGDGQARGQAHRRPGRCRDQHHVPEDADGAGGGDFSGRRLDCAASVATASGGGDIEIGAREMATGKASSGGDITFVGAPPVFNKDESSGGDVSLNAP